MRTTVDIPRDLLRAAKERAARQGETLSQLVQRALQAHLDAAKQASKEAFTLLEAGKPGGRYPSPSEVHRLLDDEAWSRPGR
jgi:hypothetical protein